MNTRHSFTAKELELIELLKEKELTKSEIMKLGYPFSRQFMLICENNGVPIYETDDELMYKKYGILKSNYRK